MKRWHAFEVLAFGAIFSAFASAQTPQRNIGTEKGEIPDNPVPHPLSWWTVKPLRLDAAGDLMVGMTGSDGNPITERDYNTDVKVLPVGELAGRKILEVRVLIQPGPRAIAAGGTPGPEPAEWKDILVAVGDGRFLSIYAQHYDFGGLIRFAPAAIYGSGPDAFLGTWDSSTGNGGGCSDGYWWFDGSGPHLIDFAPLIKAVSKAIPENGTYTPNCWALHPEAMELKSWVQRKDAQCRACGGLGQVHAIFSIEHGVAKPVSIDFKPEITDP